MKNCWSLKLSRFTIVIVLLLYPWKGYAQFSEPQETFAPQEKYIYPINPGQPGSLAGNMGELRATHFHSGIDIRTNNMTGYPVRASKSGYISRISMSPSGYGNVLYVTHSDGNTTLYAHLEEFKGSVAEYVRQEQYRRKSFDIDLYFQENQFVVKQGDTIAIAGNTGSSGGPHLHFDIRDPNNLALDPLEFGFSEIFDNTPPSAEKIALITLDATSRINDRFGRFEFHVSRVGNNFVVNAPILAHGNIGIELLAVDRFSPKSPFHGGVKFIDMHLNDQPIFSQVIDKVNIAETRSIYTLMDFKTMRMKGSRFYKLYINDGNTLDYYKTSPSNGRIKVPSEKDSKVKIFLKDAHGNASTVSFTLKAAPLTREVKSLEALKVPVSYDIYENIMMISAKLCQEAAPVAYSYSKGQPTTVNADYYNNMHAVFLLDLRNQIPDSLIICGTPLHPNIKASIPSGTSYKYYSDLMEIEFPSGALYDTVYLTLNHRATDPEVFTIGNRTIPLHRNITVSLLPQNPYSQDKNFKVYRQVGRGYTYLGGQWDNGRINFSTREFGDFVILSDMDPPTIRPIYVTNTALRFKISDSLSGIASYEATVNGNWILMHYDSKSATIWSERLDNTALMRGSFQLVVTDNAGNKKVFQQNIP